MKHDKGSLRYLSTMDGRVEYQRIYPLAAGRQVVVLEALPVHLATGAYLLQIRKNNALLLTEKVIKTQY